LLNILRQANPMKSHHLTLFPVNCLKKCSANKAHTKRRNLAGMRAATPPGEDTHKHTQKEMKKVNLQTQRKSIARFQGWKSPQYPAWGLGQEGKEGQLCTLFFCLLWQHSLEADALVLKRY
jgi:hypothetical protein